MSDQSKDSHSRRFRRWRRSSFEALDAVEASEPTREPLDRGDDELEPGLDSALVERLRTMEWPRASEDVRERCLRRIIADMEMDGHGHLNLGLTSPEITPPRPSRGVEQRHPVTRRIGMPIRAPLTLSERPVRLAAVL